MRYLGILLFSVMLAGCGDDDGAADAGGGDGGRDAAVPRPDAGDVDPLREDCEPLAPDVCAMPFPSNYFLRDGRVMFGPTTLPIAAPGGQPPAHVPGDVLASRDGFSVNASAITFLPGATTTGMARSDGIAASLETASKSVILNTATGERVPHFVMIDRVVRRDQERSIIIQPAVPLEHSTRYVVALRHVVDAAGAEIAPSEVFRALRDAEASSHPYVAQRHDDFEEIFGFLETAGVARGELQIAWDFTTASLENDTAWMLHVRDDALATVGADGPTYTIDSVMTDVDANIAKRIEGRMTVPLYLDSRDPPSEDGDPPGRLVMGPDGMPMQNGTAEYEFLVLVPRSATADNPAPPLQIAHGLLGSRRQAGGYAEIANRYNYILIAVDLVGMAEIDVEAITLILATGELERFPMVPDRLTQGMANELLSMRMMKGRFARDPEMMDGARSIVDTTRAFYAGASQGGIFGGTYMALTTDVERGVLLVPGQPYNLLLQRSVDFDPYGSVLMTCFDPGPDVLIVLNLVQQFWDRMEPGSYTRHIASNLFPGTPEHRVLLMPAIGDHQVTTQGAHIMARAIGGVRNLAPVNRSIFGIEESAGPIDGSAIVEYDFGLAPEPLDNIPATDGSDPHGAIRPLMGAAAMVDEFLRTGMVVQHCEGSCDPE